MTVLDEARDALHTFAASQGWDIRSNIVGGIAILATINLIPDETCSDCKRAIVGGDWLTDGLCNDCYEG